MVERRKSTRRAPGRLRRIKLNELSLVDKPANPHARVTLFKRDDAGDVEKKYKSVAELPPAVKNALPSAAERQFLAAVNSALDGGASDSSAFQQAWGALKNSGWHKDSKGAWVKKAAPTKTEDGKHFGAGDYAYVPDRSKPSTWKLRLTSTPGGSPDAAMVGAAAAAFSPGGHRGQQVQMPAADKARAKAKVRAAWRRANPDKDASAMPASIRKNYGEAPEPTVVAQEAQALDFDAVLAEQQAREAAERVKDDVWCKWHALQQSFRTIADDESIAAADKVSAMQTSLRQFVASLGEESAAIADAMTKAVETAAPALAELLESEDEGDEPMTAAEKQQLDELQKQVADLTSKLEAATADEPAKKNAELAADLKKASDELAELKTKLEDHDEAVAKAAMSDAEKTYMAGLSGKAKMDFMQASAADRKRMMTKAADDDPVVYKSESTGEEFRKSDDPRLVKMAKQADDSERIAKEEREKRETAELTKRADEELPHYEGDTAAKVEVLRAVGKMAEGPREALTKMLGIGDKAIAAAFQTIGTNRGKLAKAAGDFKKRVAEIKERDKCSEADAMSKARTEYPDEFQAYQETPAEAN